jgi:hypothetical protein
MRLSCLREAAAFFWLYACRSLVSDMAFIRKKVKTFKWPVTVEEPGTFDATFKRLGRAEFAKLSEKGDLQMLQQVMVGWDGINDEDGKEVPFSNSALKEFADDPYWIRGVLKGYTETFDAARQGN